MLIFWLPALTDALLFLPPVWEGTKTRLNRLCHETPVPLVTSERVDLHYCVLKQKSFLGSSLTSDRDI